MRKEKTKRKMKKYHKIRNGSSNKRFRNAKQI